MFILSVFKSDLWSISQQTLSITTNVKYGAPLGAMNLLPQKKKIPSSVL